MKPHAGRHRPPIASGSAALRTDERAVGQDLHPVAQQPPLGAGSRAVDATRFVLGWPGSPESAGR